MGTCFLNTCMNESRIKRRKMNQMVYWIICYFSNKFIWMLSIGSMDHTIDLNPNAKSIVKTPCCHFFIKNKKLKYQLSNILGKKVTHCLINLLGDTIVIFVFLKWYF